MIRSWSQTTFRAFAYPDYRKLWLGMLIASFAYSMMQIAQAVVAYDLTKRNGAVGIVTFAAGLATLIIAPVGGVLSDRVSRRLLLVAGQGMIGVLLAVIGVLLLLDWLHIATLAVFAAVIGGLFGVIVPARQSAVRTLVPPEITANGIALQQVAFSSARIVGPFVVGALVAIPFIGSGGAYLVMALMMLIVVVALSRLPNPPPDGARGVPFVRDIGAGLHHVMTTPRLALQFGAMFGFVAFGMTYQVLIPGFLDNALGHGRGEVALLYGGAALGGFLSSFGMAGLAGGRHALRGMTIGLLTAGTALLLMAAAQELYQAVAAIFLMGAGAGGFQALNQAYLLQEADPRHIGKVASISLMTFGLGQMMSYPTGFLADAIGERATLAFMGVMVLVVASVTTLLRLGLARRLPSRRAVVEEAPGARTHL